MPVDETAIGRTGVIVRTVDEAITADRFGNAGLRVLATPALVGLFEQAAMRALEGVLDDDELSVGSRVEIAHTNPTNVGGDVTAKARITEINGRELVFEVEASGEHGPIGLGTHARYVLDAKRFRARLESM